MADNDYFYSSFRPSRSSVLRSGHGGGDGKIEVVDEGPGGSPPITWPEVREINRIQVTAEQHGSSSRRITIEIAGRSAVRIAGAGLVVGLVVGGGLLLIYKILVGL